MASPECKAIEKCIKDLLYNNGPISIQSNQSLNKGPLFDSSHLASNIEKQTQQTDNNFKSDIPFEDLIPSVDRQLDQPCSSELIDLNVLKNFAEQHLNDANFPTSSLSLNCDKVPLPHPDLDENFMKLGKDKSQVDDVGTDISVLLNNLSLEIQNSPNFQSMPENPLLLDIQSPIQNVQTRNIQEKKPKKSSQRTPEEKKELKKQKKLKKKLHKELPEKALSQHSTSTSDNDLTVQVKNLRMKLMPQSLEKSDSNLPENADDFNKRATNLSQVHKEIKVKKEIFSSNWREYTILKKLNYQLICDVCESNSTEEAYIIKHFKLDTHRKQKEIKEADIYLPYLPNPLSLQVEAITEVVLNQASQFGLKDKDYETRRIVADNLKKMVEKNLPSCTVELVGSSLSQFGHKYSEVDFILKVPSDINAADALAHTYQLLLKDPGYAEVLDLFKKKIPQIQFTDLSTMLHCTLILDNGTAFQLAKLLSTYAKLDDRVPILGTVLRNWAHLCQIDNQDFGTLPSFSFALLLIYFLQQTQPPVLPVLHEVEGYSDSSNFLDTYLLEKCWQCENKDSIGLLWINFFYFYNFIYKGGDHVVCIRSSKTVSCKEKNWGTKFYAIEDPFVRRNIAYVIPTHQVYRYIQQCFVRTYRYFAYPRLSSGPLKVKAKGLDPLKDGSCEETTNSFLNESIFKEDTHEEMDSFSNNIDEHLEDHDPEIPIDLLISTIDKMILDEETGADADSSITQKANNKSPSKDSSLSPQKEIESKCSMDLKQFYYWDEDKDLVRMNFIYDFRTKIFRGEKGVPLFCKSCLGKGHLKNDCPAEALPPVLPLPNITPSFLQIIDDICISVMNENMPSVQELRCRNSDMLELQAYIRELYPDATLSLFGSFCNGFGFKRSDMDFCLTFANKENGKDLNCADIIKKVAAKLENHSKLLNVIPITSAKVPIVKFVHKDSGLDGDISLYNTLAQHNTKMLEAYSKIDDRVKILGYVLKYFAKVLKICDASRGSLSSYAYVLMVIFFLQQRNPPVIPVLQELCSEQNSVFMVEGWNAWFFEDINELKEAWPDYGKNKESIGELWIGLLNFYAKDFNLKDYVVCIRQKEPLTRFRKLWISDQIAIEDPFDLNHNLGAGLSRKMNSYILRAFIRGRERFGQPIPIERMKTCSGNELDYLFNCYYLSDGREPPNDRGCRICRKIGHLARDCTEKMEHITHGKLSRQRDMKNSSKAPYKSSYNSQRACQNMRSKQVSRRVHTPPRSNYIQQGHIPTVIKNDTHLPIGMPAHRFPPPGFKAPPGFHTNPPPGFSTPLPQQNLPNYPPPFGNQRPMMSSPFPSNVGKMAEISPKQFSASPPKLQQLNKYQAPNFSQFSHRPGYSHTQDQFTTSHAQPQAQNKFFSDRNSRSNSHQSNQQQSYDRSRTSSDPNQFNMNYQQQRW